MPSIEIKPTDGGGVEFIVIDSDDVERSVLLEPNKDGTIDIQGKGENSVGNRGTIAPGEGSEPLGK